MDKMQRKAMESKKKMQRMTKKARRQIKEFDPREMFPDDIGISKSSKLLWEEGDWVIRQHPNGRIEVGNTSSGFANWPMKIGDRIYWDHPERFPEFVKRETRKIMLGEVTEGMTKTGTVKNLNVEINDPYEYWSGDDEMAIMEIIKKDFPTFSNEIAVTVDQIEVDVYDNFSGNIFIEDELMGRMWEGEIEGELEPDETEGRNVLTYRIKKLTYDLEEY